MLAKIYTPEEMMQADNHEPAPKPRQEADLVPLLQASVEQNDRRAYQDLCDRVDAAETVAALGHVAPRCNEIAARSKRLTEGAVRLDQAGVREEEGAPADAAPSKPAEDDGPAHEANEAEAEAMAAQFRRMRVTASKSWIARLLRLVGAPRGEVTRRRASTRTVGRGPWAMDVTPRRRPTRWRSRRISRRTSARSTSRPRRGSLDDSA